ncbi:MAG: hypothetical protein CME61_02005 [Halobacteriovoraceae bacterium]|nr:hypothetical protein [Halobacteriovoraceae bacterium]
MKIKYLCILFIISLTLKNSYSFNQSTFSKINNFFESVNSELRFEEKDIKLFNDQALFKKGHQSSYYNIPLPYFFFKGSSDQTVMWIGGVHADEFAALYSSLKLIKHLLNDSHKFKKNIVFIPLLNIDGLLKGIKARGYPYRENGNRVDINRSFYAYDLLPNYTSENETEFVIELIKRYQPKHWVIPHSALGILDFDGLLDDNAKKWLQNIYEETVNSGGRPIPIKRHGHYSPPNSKINWSIGKLAHHLGNIHSLTYEFHGPGDYPRDDDPNRYQIILKRKQLGRFEDSCWLAEDYYFDYLGSFLKSLFIQ